MAWSFESDEVRHLVLNEVESDLLSEIPEELRRLILSDDFMNRVVARLFPKAYEDEVKNLEFMSYAGEDIRQRKLDNIDGFERSLSEFKQVEDFRIYPLSNELWECWLGFSNDMRLVLGTELGIDSNEWHEEKGEAFREDRRLFIYEFLTHLQCILLQPDEDL